MKKITSIIAIFLLMATIFGGCKKTTPIPSASPNVPVVSQTPAVPSPKLSPSATPKASPKVSPTVKPSTSPAQKQPATSPKTTT